MTDAHPVPFASSNEPTSSEPTSPEPGPVPAEPGLPGPGPTVPEPPSPPSQPQPTPPEVPSPPDVPTPPGDPGSDATAPRRPLPDLPHTGDPQVDEALEQLADVTDRPLEEQVEIYVGVHRRLQDRLADLDG